MSSNPHVDAVLRRLAAALESSLGTQEDPETMTTPITVDSAIEEFLLEKEAAGRSARTVDTYRQRLSSFAEGLGHALVSDVQSMDVTRYVAFLRQQQERYGSHPHRPTMRGRLSLATVDGRIQAIRAFFRWCVERGYCESSPAAHLKRPGYDPSAETRAIKPEVLKAMIQVAHNDAVDHNQPRNLAMILFMADTGVRVGELINLRIEELYLDNQTAEVRGKTGPRFVDFTEVTERALRYWLGQRPACDHDLVFCSIGDGNRGEPLTGNAVYLALRSLAVRADVEDERWNPHSIRHLVGQIYVDETNLELARKKLGHRHVTTTAMHYANQDRSRLRQATERLSLASRIGGLSGGLSAD